MVQKGGKFTFQANPFVYKDTARSTSGTCVCCSGSVLSLEEPVPEAVVE